MTTEAKLDELELGRVEKQATADAALGMVTRLEPNTVLYLVAEVRRARSLESALAVLQDAGLTYVDDTAEYDLSEAGLVSLAADYKERLGT